ncbi:RNA polymerase subunit sigma-24 [Streptomyces sp. NBC_01217]|uniref:RNA polymerase subunit sigma-24 n=1 Tax=Streptomyces sp. NBC_01217 TaxID=2903779 RepID=UPI002E161266|nr:RNA polymerase subunit sigma-24 [Streptomyces sp. NBC_01217]
MDKNQEVELFLAEVDDERLHLPNIAFRVPGTTGDAERAVQGVCAFRYRPGDTWRAAIDVPQAWLTPVAYVGDRLPEPASSPATTLASTPVGAGDRFTLDESVKTVLMFERAVFALHDMLALPFGGSAVIVVGRTRQMCRKLASFARRRVCDRCRRESASDAHTRIVTAFWAACDLGDLAALVSLLDPDATMLSDGGGKVRAALHPVHGADRTARFMLAALSRHPRLKATLQSVNGKTGLILRHGTTVSGVVSFHVKKEKITDVWLVLNPDKLRSWNQS